MAWIIRALAVNLLLLNFGLYAVVSCIAGWALNLAIDKPLQFQARDTFPSPASQYFIEFALIAGVVGMASVLSSLYHVRVWKHETLGSTTAPSFIAWLLTLLATGLACKEIHLGGHRTQRMIVLESFVIILSGTQLLYLMAVHAGILCGECGHRACAAPTEEAAHKSSTST